MSIKHLLAVAEANIAAGAKRVKDGVNEAPPPEHNPVASAPWHTPDTIRAAAEESTDAEAPKAAKSGKKK